MTKHLLKDNENVHIPRKQNVSDMKRISNNNFKIREISMNRVLISCLTFYFPYFVQLKKKSFFLLID